MCVSASFVEVAAPHRTRGAFFASFPAFDLLSDIYNLPFVRSGEEGLGWCEQTGEVLSNTKVLLLNYSAYDSAYAEKIGAILLKQLPCVELLPFWKGSPQQLAAQLSQCRLVVVPYPANDPDRLARAYGKVLRQFVARGGAVVFCGTDRFSILQQYNLFDLDFGYFCTTISVHEDDKAHPIFRETPEDFVLANYVYPLDVSDPAYVSLANVRGYSTAGYKSIGQGKVIYIGFEYYYDEPIATQILINAVNWLCSGLSCKSGSNGQEKEADTGMTAPENSNLRSIRRVEEYLYAGSGAGNAVEMKIFPNPYVEKAFLDFTLEKSATVFIEMTDESGVRIALLLPYRNLNPGQYRVELPNVSPGIYFVKCQIDGRTATKKVVKSSI